MALLHDSLRRALLPLESVCSTGFPVSISQTERWKCFPVVVSYCCDIVEAKNISAVKHGQTTPTPCHRCLASPTEFSIPSQALKRHRNQKLRARNEYANNVHESTSSQSLDSLSLAPWASCLETMSVIDPGAIPDLYSIFTFEPLHNLFLGTSMRIKELLTSYLTTTSLLTHPDGPTGKRRPFSSVRNSVLRGCNTVLAILQRDYVLDSTKLYFPNNEPSSQLNCLYVTQGLRSMLVG